MRQPCAIPDTPKYGTLTGDDLLGFQYNVPHAFSNASIRAHAPPASGVYGISNASRWLYIGETANIQERLLQHLADSGNALTPHSPAGFSYEICESAARALRRQRLVAKYNPVLNRTEERAEKGN